MAEQVAEWYKSKAIIGGLLSLALGIAVWWQPLFLGRLMERPDTVTHLRWSYEFFVALQEGVLYPRWAFASHEGLGDPTFLYYQPLFYYVTAFLSALGFAAERALSISTCLPYVLLSWLVYAETAGDGPKWRAMAGAALVATCPAVYFLMMNGGAFPWGLAIPFCIFFVLESIKDQPSVAKTAIWISLVCLTHLLSGLIVLMCVGVARLVFAFPGRKTWAANLRWAAGIILGISLAAFFVYPAISQQALINPAGWTTDPSLDWHRSFAFPFFSWWQYGLQWFSFQWGLPLLALAFSVVVMLLLRRAPRSGVEIRAWRLTLVAMAGLVLSSELAYPLFALIAPLQKLQWAYRFVPLSLALADLAFATIAFRSTAAGEAGWLRAACIGLVAAHCVLAAGLQYKVYASGESLRTIGVALQGEFGQPEYLIARRGPDWPRYNQDGQFAAECRQLGAGCAIVKKQTHDLSLLISVPRPLTIRLPVFAFPAWQVRVDGQVQPLKFDETTGLISVPLSTGQHAVDVAWIGLPAQALGNLLSWVALALLGLTAVLEYRGVSRPFALGRRTLNRA